LLRGAWPVRKMDEDGTGSPLVGFVR